MKITVKNMRNFESEHTVAFFDLVLSDGKDSIFCRDLSLFRGNSGLRPTFPGKPGKAAAGEKAKYWPFFILSKNLLAQVKKLAIEQYRKNNPDLEKA